MMPPGLRDLDLQQLMGVSLGQARQVVEAAGGTFRAVGVDEDQGLPTAMTADLSPRRVTVMINRGRVVQVLGIG